MITRKLRFFYWVLSDGSSWAEMLCLSTGGMLNNLPLPTGSSWTLSCMVGFWHWHIPTFIITDIFPPRWDFVIVGICWVTIIIIIMRIMIIAFCTSQHRNLRSYHKARHWILILWIIGKTFCHRENVSAILPPDSHLSSCQPQRWLESLHFSEFTFTPPANMFCLRLRLCSICYDQQTGHKSKRQTQR